MNFDDELRALSRELLPRDMRAVLCVAHFRKWLLATRRPRGVPVDYLALALWVWRLLVTPVEHPGDVLMGVWLWLTRPQS